MSFLTVVEDAATEVEQALVKGGKDLVTYIENVVVIDIEPALEQVLKNAIVQLGQTAVALLLGKATAQTVEPVTTPAEPTVPPAA